MAFVQRRSIVAVEGCDYADAFECPIPDGDSRTAEEMVWAGLNGAPSWLGLIVLIAHRYVLRLELAPPATPNHLVGWEIVDAEPDRMEMRASGPLVEGALVARRILPSTAVLETFVTYRRPVLARRIWMAVAPIHRAVAPVLLRRAATAFVER
jgi:hypothetical protein